MVMDPAEWDRRYREKPLLWSAGPNRFVEEVLADADPGSALDVACGEGRNAVWLAERGFLCTGVDFSTVALARARAAAADREVDVTWVEADIEHWSTPDLFDLVLVAYVHLHDRAGLLGKAVSWVAPGGRLVMVGHDCATAGVSGPSDPDLLWTVDEVVEGVGPLSVERAEIVSRKLEDGSMAADTLVVARRAHTLSSA